MKETRSLLAVSLVYFLLVLPAFYPFLFENKTLYQGDIFLYFEPMLRYMCESTEGGRLPLWNSLVSNGIPQIAIISPGLFYPPNYIFCAMSFGTALGAIMMFHQWIAGMGTFLLARREGFGTIASTICGAVLMLSGYFFGSSQCYTLPATFAWTPLGLWLVSRYVGGGSRRLLLLLTLLYALQILAGRPELFISAGFLYLAYTLVCKIELNDDGLEPLGKARKADARHLLMIALALGCGAAIAAPALLPVVELYSLSPRMSGLRLSEVALWSAGWFDWLQMLVCRPFGDLVVSNYFLNPHYPGLFPYISSLYLGPAVLSLSVLGLFHRAWQQKLFWILVGPVFFLLALGEFGPLLPGLHQAIPGAGILRYPIKLAVFVLFALSMAAGAGWDYATRSGAPGWLLKSLGAIWFAVLAFAAGLFFNLGGVRTAVAAAVLNEQFSAHGEVLQELLGATAVQLCAVSVLGLLAVVLVPGLRKTVRLFEPRRIVSASAMSVLALGPMLVAGAAALWHYTDDSFFSLNSPVAAEINRRRAQTPNSRTLVMMPDAIVAPEWMWRRDDPLMHSIVQSQYERTILNGDVNVSYRIPTAYGFVPTDTRAFMMLYNGVQSRSQQYVVPSRIGEATDLPLYRFCQVCGVRDLITLSMRPNPRRHVIEPMPPLDENYFLLAHQDPRLNVRIYEVGEFLPRIYMTYNWRPVESQVAALKEIFWADRSNFDPVRQTLLQTSKVPSRQSETAVEPAHAELVQDAGETITIDARAATDGYLVLSDTDYPGWKVSVDGQPAEIVQANGLHKAVFLSAGKHRVVFRYQPYTLFWGCVISAVTLTGLLFILLRGRQKRSRLD